MHKTLQMDFQAALRGRWNNAWPKSGQFGMLHSVFERTLSATSAITTKTEAIKQTGKFSQKGCEDEIKAFAQVNAIPVYREASQGVDRAISALKAKRTELGVPKPSSNEVTALMLRSEMRAYLRSLPAHQALQVLMDREVDERILQAAFEVPPQMVGLTVQMRDTVQSRLIDHRHKADIEVLDQLEEAIALSSSALEMGLRHMREEAGFRSNQDAQFDAWMDKATAEVDQREREARAAETALELIARLSMDLDREIDAIFARVMSPHLT